jgi:hypothetical protein
MNIRSKATARGIAALAFSGTLLAGAAGAASADAPVFMNGYQYAGTYSSTGACSDEGDYLESWAAATDYFCYTSGSEVWLYIDPAADD